MSRRVVAALVATALVMTACGSDDRSGEPATTAGSAAPTTAPTDTTAGSAAPTTAPTDSRGG